MKRTMIKHRLICTSYKQNYSRWFNPKDFYRLTELFSGSASAKDTVLKSEKGRGCVNDIKYVSVHVVSSIVLYRDISNFKSGQNKFADFQRGYLVDRP